ADVNRFETLMQYPRFRELLNGMEFFIQAGNKMSSSYNMDKRYKIASYALYKGYVTPKPQDPFSVLYNLDAGTFKALADYYLEKKELPDLHRMIRIYNQTRDAEPPPT